MCSVGTSSASAPSPIIATANTSTMRRPDEPLLLSIQPNYPRYPPVDGHCPRGVFGSRKRPKLLSEHHMGSARVSGVSAVAVLVRRAVGRRSSHGADPLRPVRHRLALSPHNAVPDLPINDELIMRVMPGIFMSRIGRAAHNGGIPGGRHEPPCGLPARATGIAGPVLEVIWSGRALLAPGRRNRWC